MVTCQVYKKVELLKFLEVEGIELTINEGLYSDHIPNFDSHPREFEASIRIFALDVFLDQDKGVNQEVISGVGLTPNEAIRHLAVMIEGDCRDLHKEMPSDEPREYTRGYGIAIPPLKHTDCEIINDVVDYEFYRHEKNEVFNYSKYE